MTRRRIDQTAFGRKTCVPHLFDTDTCHTRVSHPVHFCAFLCVSSCLTRCCSCNLSEGALNAIYRVNGRVTAQPTESGGDCFSRFLCLLLVCTVSVLHILCLWWLKLSSQWKSTHWVQGFVTSCCCLVFDSPTVVAEHGSGTESGGVTAT